MKEDRNINLLNRILVRNVSATGEMDDAGFTGDVLGETIPPAMFAMKKLINFYLLAVLGLCATCLANPNPYNENHGPFEPGKWPAKFKLQSCDSSTWGSKQSIVGFDIKAHYKIRRRPNTPELLVVQKPNWHVWWLIVIDPEKRILAGPTAISSSGPISQVYWADLNGDSTEDFVVHTSPGSWGSIHVHSCNVTFVFSTKSGYRISSTIGHWFGLKYFVDIDRDGRCEFIHTRFVNGRSEKAQDGKRHNYWVYNILQPQEGGLIFRNRLAPKFPRWIRYTYKPNHQPTTMITEKQKKRLWAQYDSTVFWKYPGRLKVKTVRLDRKISHYFNSFILVFNPKRSQVDYRAPSMCSLPETDPYAVVRGGYDGLVCVRTAGNREQRKYVIKSKKIRAVIDAYEGIVITEDWDFVFTDVHLVAVRRSNCNAGIFSNCDVWEIPYQEVRETMEKWMTQKWMTQNGSLEGPLLKAVLEFYENEIKR